MAQIPGVHFVDYQQIEELYPVENYEAPGGGQLGHIPYTETYYAALGTALSRADGRWVRAYQSGKDMKIPGDLQAAIDAEPKAKAMLAKLSAQNRFALAFRTHNMKTEAGRKKKIEAFVAMLKRGETIHPQKAKAAGRVKK